MNVIRTPISLSLSLSSASAQTEDLKVAGIKWVSGFPTNVPKGIPSVVGLIIMNDSETGKKDLLLEL